MIHFVVGAEGSFSIRFYLDEEGIALRNRMRVVLYDELAQMDRLALGTWVFTEIDRLCDAERDLATFACQRLATANGAARVMNHPSRALRRLDLLRAASAAGMNRFRAWRAADIVFAGGRRTVKSGGDVTSAAMLRYPVFVRFEDQHTRNM